MEKDKIKEIIREMVREIIKERSKSKYHIIGNYVTDFWSDHIQSLSYFIANLSGAGVKARMSDTSPYVGHKVLSIYIDDVKKAIDFVKKSGNETWEFALKPLENFK